MNKKHLQADLSSLFTLEVIHHSIAKNICLGEIGLLDVFYLKKKNRKGLHMCFICVAAFSPSPLRGTSFGTWSFLFIL